MRHLKKRSSNFHFPLECRTTAGEAGYLSPTQGQESAFIAFHMYKGMSEEPYFKWVHTLMQKYKGRPHWGKQSHLTAEHVHGLYPAIDKFLEVRALYDPDDVFFHRLSKKNYSFCKIWYLIEIRNFTR